TVKGIDGARRAIHADIHDRLTLPEDLEDADAVAAGRIVIRANRDDIIDIDLRSSIAEITLDIDAVIAGIDRIVYNNSGVAAGEEVSHLDAIAIGRIDGISAPGSRSPARDRQIPFIEG